MRVSRIALASLVAAAALSASAPALAASLRSLFDEGNEAFWNGDYDAAAAAWGKLEDLGARDPALSYNLGTAEARRGNLGRAVLNYERALGLDPGHADARHNLGLVREFLARRASGAGRDADLAPAVGPWRAVLDRFSPTSAATAFLVFYLALFGVLIVRRLVAREMPRLSLGVVAGVLAILAVATGAVAVGKWHQETRLSEAIVVAEGTLEVREGPGSDVERFALEEGSRVEIVEELDEWSRLTDDQGRDGWVPSGDLERI